MQLLHITGILRNPDRPLFITSEDLGNGDLFRWDLTNADLFFNKEDVFTFVLQADGVGYNIAGNDPPGYKGGNLFRKREENTELSDIGFITYVTPEDISGYDHCLWLENMTERMYFTLDADGTVYGYSSTQGSTFVGFYSHPFVVFSLWHPEAATAPIQHFWDVDNWTGEELSYEDGDVNIWSFPIGLCD